MTKYISYTYDEGLTWDELQISEEGIYIKNILNAPYSAGQKFITDGYKHKSDSEESENIIISLDFSTLNIIKCGSSDYETWIPSSSAQKIYPNFA